MAKDTSKTKTPAKKTAVKTADKKVKTSSVKETGKGKKPGAAPAKGAPKKASSNAVKKPAAGKAAAKPAQKTAVVKPSAKKPAGKDKPVSLAKVAKTVNVEEKASAGLKSISLKEALKSSNSIPMFKNPLLEKLSHVHPLTPIFIYVPVIFLSIYYYFFSENSSLFSFLIFYTAGAFTWTITEYTLHRFVFHPPFADTHMKWFYFYVHGVHHEVPTDATRLVMPPGASIPLAVLFFFLFQALIPEGNLAFFAGFVTGYLIYDFLHFATHFFTFEWEWFKKLRKHHNVHHFNAENKNFGVSNSLWDYVFSTKYRSGN